MGFLNYDSPLMSGLGKLADLVILNLLTLLFCIPIVTIGASLTACHYVTLFFDANGTVGALVKGVLFVALVFWAFISCWIFPVQSKFINNIGTTFKNSFLLAFKYLFRTILMLVINLIPLNLAFSNRLLQDCL